MPQDSTPRILPTLILNGFSPGSSGHLAAGQRQRHLASNLKIRRTADDLPHALAVVHLAERQAVGVRVLLLLQHLGDHDVFESAGHLLHALDLEPNHGQLLGEFLGRRVEVDVLLQPVVGNFHFLGEAGENRGAAEYAKTGKNAMDFLTGHACTNFATTTRW